MTEGVTGVAAEHFIGGLTAQADLDAGTGEGANAGHGEEGGSDNRLVLMVDEAAEFLGQVGAVHGDEAEIQIEGFGGGFL